MRKVHLVQLCLIAVVFGSMPSSTTMAERQRVQHPLPQKIESLEEQLRRVIAEHAKQIAMFEEVFEKLIAVRDRSGRISRSNDGIEKTIQRHRELLQRTKQRHAAREEQLRSQIRFWEVPRHD